MDISYKSIPGISSAKQYISSAQECLYNNKTAIEAVQKFKAVAGGTFVNFQGAAENVKKFAAAHKKELIQVGAFTLVASAIAVATKSYLDGSITEVPVNSTTPSAKPAAFEKELEDKTNSTFNPVCINPVNFLDNGFTPNEFNPLNTTNYRLPTTLNQSVAPQQLQNNVSEILLPNPKEKLSLEDGLKVCFVSHDSLINFNEVDKKMFSVAPTIFENLLARVDNKAQELRSVITNSAVEAKDQAVAFGSAAADFVYQIPVRETAVGVKDSFVDSVTAVGTKVREFMTPPKDDNWVYSRNKEIYGVTKTDYPFIERKKNRPKDDNWVYSRNKKIYRVTKTDYPFIERKKNRPKDPSTISSEDEFYRYVRNKR